MRAPIERVLAKTVHGDVPARGDVCWIFIGSRGPTGYGQVGVGSRVDGSARTARVHRVSYEHFIGPIPEGLEIDHLCGVRACVNPAHLEAVTHRVNSLRGTNPLARNARKTHCKHGHPLTPENVYIKASGGRECRECRRLYMAAHRLGAAS